MRAPFAALVLVALVVSGCADLGAPAGSGNIDDRPRAPAWGAISVGAYSSCAVTSDGSPYCWGYTLANNCTSGACAVAARPTLVSGAPAAFDTVVSGGGFQCGITTAREAWCWGDMLGGLSSSSLGDGSTTRSAVPVRVALLSPVRAITAGYGHACALTADGVAYCWSGASAGVLGTGDSTRVAPLPVRVATTLRFTAISAGTTHTCAIAADSTAWCWGSGFGALGAGVRDTSCTYSASCLVALAPIPVDGGLRWSSISAGNAFTCAVAIDHRGYCWGAVPIYGDPNPPTGVLGTGTFGGSKSPVAVAGGLAFQLISTGTRQACGLTLDGAAWCWGDNGSGELGIGAAGPSEPAPRAVVGGIRFTSLSVGEVSCGLSEHRNLYCWGVTAGGMLGTGESAAGMHATPQAVATPTS